MEITPGGMIRPGPNGPGGADETARGPDLLIRAVLSLLVGTATLVWPAATIWVLAVLLGCFLVVFGGIGLVRAFRHRRDAGWATILGSAVAVVVGVLALVWPKATVAVLAVLFGIHLVVQGGLLVIQAVRTRSSSSVWGLDLTMGALSLGVGIVTLAWPQATVWVLAILLGCFWIVNGVVLLTAWFALRRSNN